MTIHMNKDPNGKKWGNGNNPKKEGSLGHKQFSYHVDGVTVKQAKDNGLTQSNLRHDLKDGYITIKEDPKAEAEEAKRKAEAAKAKADAKKAADAAKAAKGKPADAAKAA